MEIDKVAFVVAANGYLSETLYLAAREVESIKLRGNEDDFRQPTAQIFFTISLTVMVVSWVLAEYIFG